MKSNWWRVMQCKCGNVLATLAPSCPRCGKSYIAMVAAIVLLSVLLLSTLTIVVLTIFG